MFDLSNEDAGFPSSPIGSHSRLHARRTGSSGTELNNVRSLRGVFVADTGGDGCWIRGLTVLCFRLEEGLPFRRRYD